MVVIDGKTPSATDNIFPFGTNILYFLNYFKCVIMIL